MTVSKQSQDRTQFHHDSAWKWLSKSCMKHTSANVRYKTPDDEQRRCPKNVEFYNRTNFG